MLAFLFPKLGWLHSTAGRMALIFSDWVSFQQKKAVGSKIYVCTCGTSLTNMCRKKDKCNLCINYEMEVKHSVQRGREGWTMLLN